MHNKKLRSIFSQETNDYLKKESLGENKWMITHNSADKFCKEIYSMNVLKTSFSFVSFLLVSPFFQLKEERKQLLIEISLSTVSNKVIKSLSIKSSFSFSNYKQLFILSLLFLVKFETHAVIWKKAEQCLLFAWNS